MKEWIFEILDFKDFRFSGPLRACLGLFFGPGAALPRNFKMASVCMWLVELE